MNNKQFKADIKLKSDSEIIDLQKQLAIQHRDICSLGKVLTSKLAILKHELKIRRKDSALPFVSDHAIIRYMERVQKVDIDDIRHRIANKIPPNAKADKLTHIDKDGFRYLISNDGQCVTTVYDPTKMDGDNEKDNNSSDT